jgi:hypothetical protein
VSSRSETLRGTDTSFSKCSKAKNSYCFRSWLRALVVCWCESFAKSALQHYVVTKPWAVYTSVRDQIDDQDDHKPLPPTPLPT